MSLTLILIALGGVSLLKVCFRLIFGFKFWLSSIFGSRLDMKKFGQWAIVTGSTDGIGKAYAFELAKKGLDIVLISRNYEKLEETAEAIKEKYPVKVMCISADFGDRNCYKNIANEIKNLDVGVLVNNVGMAISKAKNFFYTDEEFLLKQLDVNCGSAVVMTRMVLPDLVAKRRGLVVNISSMASNFPLFYCGIYSATKAFINMFSLALKGEVSKYNIQIKCLTPGYVNTKMLDFDNSPLDNLKRKYSFLFPSPSDYVQSSLSSLNNKFLFSTGYWSHTLMGAPMAWTNLSDLDILTNMGLQKIFQ